MSNETYFLATLNATDNPSHATIAGEVAADDIEVFAARFINGLVHQTHVQTGHSRPIGDTTANRIMGDIFALANQLLGQDRKYDCQKVHSLLRLNMKPGDHKSSS